MNFNKCLISDDNQENKTVKSSIWQNYHTVSQLNNLLVNLLDKNIEKNIYVIGEIINLGFRNHVYFSLKDENSKIDCFLWESTFKRKNIELKNGIKLICKGRYSLYEPLGKLQLTVHDFILEGVGKLQKKFNKFKEEYEELGYFNKNIKKNMKEYNQKIGVITSLESSAYQDVLSVIKRKNSTINLFVVDAKVQGKNCCKNICDGIRKLEKLDLDVILITRGGGSPEDLWGFNEPCLIEMIFNCKTIIVSAIGHQTDYTLCDYVSDIRAITPSIGIDIILKNFQDIKKKIKFLQKEILEKLKDIFLKEEIYLQNKKNKLEKYNPVLQYEKVRSKINLLFEKINIESKYKIENLTKDLSEKKNKIEFINPNNILKKGYLLLKDNEDNLISSLLEFKNITSFKLVFSDGEKIFKIK